MKNIIIYTFFLLYTCIVQAQTPVLTLTQAIDSVEKNYPEIIKYESKIKSVQVRVEGAKAWMPPTISAGPEQFFYNPAMLKDMSPMNRAGISINIEQMIPNSGKLNAKKNYLQSLASVDQSNAKWSKNTFHYYTKNLYYQRVVAEKSLLLVEENKELLGMLIKSSESRYTYNQADLSSIFKAKAKLEELKNMEVMLIATIAESNIGLNTLMNSDINTSFSIDTTLTFNNNITTVEKNDTSVTNRSDIQAMQHGVISMRLNKQLMNAQRKPDFGVSFSHMQMFGMPNQYTLMGMMTIPIVPWSSKMYKSEVKSMGFEIEFMTKEIEGMQLMAQRMISEKLVMLNAGNIQLANFQKGIIPMYKKNFEANMLAYKQNTGNLFILLDSWEMLLMKKMEYNNKLFEVKKIEAEYEYEAEKR